jgi:hypothetical protein
MSPVIRSALPIPSGYTSAEVASFIAQLDDQSRRQTAQTRGLTIADLEWQPAPGMNTIGMLMAHQAIVEVWWCGLILEDQQGPNVRFQEILGISDNDDGMPLAEGGSPPAILTGKDLAFYDDLLDRARRHLKSVAPRIHDADLGIIRTRPRPNGDLREVEMRWAIYHILEHFAGHFGQILVLQHARKSLALGDAARR